MEGWAYLTAIIYLFDRKVVGWHINSNMRALDTVIPVLNKACSANLRYLNQELVIHPDRSQYACNEFKNALKTQKGIIQSMRGKGN